MLATSVYLASAASIRSLVVSAILSKVEWGDGHLDKLLEVIRITQSRNAGSIWSKQKVWHIGQ